MLVWDSPEAVNAWVASRAGGCAHAGSFTALGWTKSDKLIAGLVFYDSNGRNCMVNIALDGRDFPIGLLKAGLRYVFGQLQLRRLTFIVAEDNIRSRNLCTALGAVHEATLQDAGITGSLLVYKLLPENCKIWSRINGQGRGVSTPST